MCTTSTRNRNKRQKHKINTIKRLKLKKKQGKTRNSTDGMSTERIQSIDELTEQVVAQRLLSLPSSARTTEFKRVGSESVALKSSPIGVREGPAPALDVSREFVRIIRDVLRRNER